MKILQHPIFAPCTCDKCRTVFQTDVNDELETVFYEGVIQAWKIECPVCRHRCNLEWAGLINPSDVTDTNVGHKSEWISVEERLPEEKQKVLLYSPADGIQIGHRLDEVGRFYVSKSYPERPTHWMPLPVPPEGD